MYKYDMHYVNMTVIEFNVLANAFDMELIHFECKIENDLMLSRLQSNIIEWNGMQYFNALVTATQVE